MNRWWATVMLVLASTPAAHADDDQDTLTAHGEELARAGEYTRAIEAFKQADAKQPSAKHACLIGLVYTRRELWSQAEIFLERCRARASPVDPLPDWFTEAVKQLATKLTEVDVGVLDIRVDPPNASISLSTFPADETFEPRQIHLPPGKYELTASAPGYVSRTETVTIKLGAPQAVSMKLVPLHVATVRQPEPASHLDRYVLYTAGGLAVAGGLLHVLAYRELQHLDNAATNDDPMLYSAHRGTFDVESDLAIGCYVVAGFATIGGIVLHVRNAPTITASVTHEAALIGFEVRR